MSERGQISFGEYRFDLDARQLFRGDERVPLSPKAFLLLKLLIERSPAALSKAELIRVIWPGTFVSDGSLTQLVKELRRATGGGSGTRVVRTVHCFGYAFGGLVEPMRDRAPGPAFAECQWSLRLDERDIPLSEGENMIGRDQGSTIQLQSPLLSRYHARLMVTGARCVLEDLKSKNGTYLRGERVDAPVPLRRGDILRVGPFSLTVQQRRPTLTTETEQLTADG
jgi:DNA-binding winged helix-turn-helix (wHTH) protein